MLSEENKRGKSGEENLSAQHGARTLRGPFRRINLWQQPCGERPQWRGRGKPRDSKSIERPDESRTTHNETFWRLAVDITRPFEANIRRMFL
jgi:hypothetical protein